MVIDHGRVMEQDVDEAHSKEAVHRMNSFDKANKKIDELAKQRDSKPGLVHAGPSLWFNEKMNSPPTSMAARTNGNSGYTTTVTRTPAEVGMCPSDARVDTYVECLHGRLADISNRMITRRKKRPSSSARRAQISRRRRPPSPSALRVAARRQVASGLSPARLSQAAPGLRMSLPRMACSHSPVPRAVSQNSPNLLAACKYCLLNYKGPGG